MPLVTWLFNIGILFLNEWYDGYQFQHIHDLAAPLVLPHVAGVPGSYVGRIWWDHASMADIIQYHYAAVNLV